MQIFLLLKNAFEEKKNFQNAKELCNSDFHLGIVVPAKERKKSFLEEKKKGNI